MYGYYEHPDVLALQDLEAMLKDHNVVRPSNGLPPERICFVQCVGSRDRHIGNEYCSKVCCGVASKEAIEVRQQLPDCKVFIFYIDMRMYGYWENQIYWPAQEEHHVQYIKGIITEVLKKGDKLLVRGEDTTMGRPMEVAMDMVILSVGMEPSKGTRAMAGILGIEPNKYGFINAANPPLDTVSTSRQGILACGASLGPGRPRGLRLVGRGGGHEGDGLPAAQAGRGGLGIAHGRPGRRHAERRGVHAGDAGKGLPRRAHFGGGAARRQGGRLRRPARVARPGPRHSTGPTSAGSCGASSPPGARPTPSSTTSAPSGSGRPSTTCSTARAW